MHTRRRQSSCPPQFALRPLNTNREEGTSQMGSSSNCKRQGAHGIFSLLNLLARKLSKEPSQYKAMKGLETMKKCTLKRTAALQKPSKWNLQNCSANNMRRRRICIKQNAYITQHREPLAEGCTTCIDVCTRSFSKFTCFSGTAEEFHCGFNCLIVSPS